MILLLKAINTILGKRRWRQERAFLQYTAYPQSPFHLRTKSHKKGSFVWPRRFLHLLSPPPLPKGQFTQWLSSFPSEFSDFFQFLGQLAVYNLTLAALWTFSGIFANPLSFPGVARPSFISLCREVMRKPASVREPRDSGSHISYFSSTI